MRSEGQKEVPRVVETETRCELLGIPCVPLALLRWTHLLRGKGSSVGAHQIFIIISFLCLVVRSLCSFLLLSMCIRKMASQFVPPMPL
jgi:hypothetical protein